ncbi:MAG: DUF4837 family protein [Alistipes sp.]|jgi:hypothetical protein|nr:DUF4837 family protein [Alistipes sp.]
MSRLLLLSLLLLTVACGGTDSFKYDAQGAPYEIVLVADHDVWDGPAGDSLRATFHRRYPMINREETTFDILRVLPSGFNRLVTRHHNVLIADIDPAYTSPALTIARDVYAQPQMVLSASAPDMTSLAQLVADNADDILLALETAEKDRDVANATTHTPPAVSELIRSKFGFEMSTGPGYEVRSESEDFLWLSYEMPVSSQGIVIYSYPFSGVRDFERDNLIARRNEFMARIPGENPGSHMATVNDYVSLLYKRIDGRQWAEMHGFWDVRGDFMGGPYTNYSTFDAARQRVISIDFYVYSPDPRLSQRNYIRQLEHFIYTTRISGETPTWEELGRDI